MKLPRQPPLWPLVALALYMIPSMVGSVSASSHHHGHNRHGHLHFSHVPDAAAASDTALVESSPQDLHLSPRFLQAHVNLKSLAADPSDSDPAGQGDFACGPDKPCSNGACCGESGWCGYGPIYCGQGCQSNCDAAAECGQFSKDAGAGCPLNVCCSEFGFCGTTAEFCGQGCQSNCEQPKPSGPSSDSQQRIIGYWEAWNPQHPCGTMNVGEIPVSYLTHLNIAFGYVSPDFKVTNMDGVSSDVYRNIGNLKSRNPALKIVISLGGWAFSDPGPWRSVFPTMVSSSSNRATFIQNLLGFLSEYGYDGVDFDWEYPGASDRGGSDVDAANYVALLKELRDAINSNGKDYTVTFTAPTSFWYLRHFDIKGMEPYVDWINLMSYDLHGVWDSTDPIGPQVLAHTNLTEIDMALDLFWRAEIAPSSIVLGLAFYGRTFNLKSLSCWKPGCPFMGPGDAGPCTDTAGILSYREVQSILAETGATSYLDKDAAVRYLVYGQNSWVSYDDEITFQAKIDYANKMGLSGLMVWAIDLDDSRLDALRAVSKGKGPAGIESLFDLKNLFPQEDLPPSGSPTSYGLVPFGSSGDMSDPSPGAGPFGFMVIAGDSYAVTSLKKRSNEPEPMVFLDCPPDARSQPKDKVQKARVTCLSDDVKGCFRVLERGVEGTVVEMPHNCAPNSFARAISLEVSDDQSLPQSIKGKTPTSPVFDFSFDLNLGLMRRDTNNTSMRVDYSNMQGYWDQIVNAPGIQSGDSDKIKARFFGPTPDDWNNAFEYLKGSSEDSTKIKEDVDATVFWNTVQGCVLDNGETVDEGFGAFVSGSLDIEFWFGLSLIATLDEGNFTIQQAHGYLKAKGQTDLTYTIARIGNIDLSKANQGNPAFSRDAPVDLDGITVVTSDALGRLAVNPYWQLQYEFATVNGSEGTDLSSSGVTFSGRMNTHVVTDLGDFAAHFPSESLPLGAYNDKREKNKISIPDDDVLYGTSPGGGQIALGTVLTFGIKLHFLDISDSFSWNTGLPELALEYNTMGYFSFSHCGPDQDGLLCSNYEVITNAYQFSKASEALGWDPLTNNGQADLVYDRQQPYVGELCYIDMAGQTTTESLLRMQDAPGRASDETNNSTEKRSRLHPAVPHKGLAELEKRQVGSIDDGWFYPGFGGGVDINPNSFQAADGPPILPDSAPVISSIPVSNSPPCFRCATLTALEKDRASDTCCGCVSMDWLYGYTDNPCDDSCDAFELDGPWVDKSPSSNGLRNGLDSTQEEEESFSLSVLEKRVQGVASMSPKRVKICTSKVQESTRSVSPYLYPAFPSPHDWPWDGIEGGKWDSISRYWHNASADCTDWSVKNFTVADEAITPTGKLRVPYQTEHVFEGQIIGEFFTSWLDKGLVNSKASTTSQKPTMFCEVTKSFMMTYTYEFKLPDKDGVDQIQPFVQLLLSELGNESHLDRLAILLGRVNMRKGGLFSGTAGVDITKFKKSKGPEAQLLAAKELGMVFSYLNAPEIWTKFCATHDAIYKRLESFNTWYNSHDYNEVVKIPELKDEWKKYVRAVLDRVVLRSQSTFDNMYSESMKLLPPKSPFIKQWETNKVSNRPLIKLSGKCDNLDPPGVTTTGTTTTTTTPTPTP